MIVLGQSTVHVCVFAFTVHKQDKEGGPFLKQLNKSARPGARLR